METNNLPIACDPQAFGNGGWVTHQTLSKQLFQQVLEQPQEIADGYLFHFPATQFLSVASFVEGERRCCPFFTFQIHVPANAAAITLQITGSQAAKHLIAAELGTTEP